jgi:hypothetical protein
MKKLWLTGAAAALGMSGLAANASVVTLDWNKVTQGTLPKQGSTFTEAVNVGGGEVKVSIVPSGPVSPNRFGSPGMQTPAVTNTIFQGGLSSNFSNLSTVADFKPAQGGDPTLTFTIDFLGFKQGISKVNFSLFDIDSNPRRFVDEITFRTPGVSLTGSVDNVVSGNTVRGVAQSNNLGAGSGDANVGVKYGSLPSNQIVFTYSSPTPNEVLHGFALGNISFTPVPEANQLAIGLTACLLGAVWLRRTGRRKAVTLA